VSAKERKPDADTTDSVKLAAEVSGVSEDGEYDVSDIFVNPEDAELLDKLSEAYRQNNNASLDVKRGVIADVSTREAPKEKVAVPDYKYPPVELLTEDTSTGDDDIKEEREIGLAAGLGMLWFCDELWVCGETVTEGMKKEIQFCKHLNIKIRHVSEKEIRKKIGGISYE
jgi:hypothetical protein